jgi:2-iminobutanoate/2-iminopropanoate deaminase
VADKEGNSKMSKPVGPYSPTRRAGGWLIVSGQVGISPSGLAEGFDAQLQQALDNLRGLLEGEGASMDDVVKTTVFLTTMDDYARMNEIYIAAFGDNRPSRSAVAVAQLPIGALVEIEAWAWVG